MNLSIVVPVFNEQDCVELFYKEVQKVFPDSGADLEIIYVDDGSRDQTSQKLKHLHELDSRVKYIRFSRNFGKEAALYAGLQKSSGDLVAVMDVDLQDPPALLPTMIEEIVRGGYDSVATRRVTRRGEPPIRSFFARQFYRIINRLSDIEMVDGARDYRMMTRQMVDAILALQERGRYSMGIFSWVGFETKWLEYENQERAAGETKWSFRKLFGYAIEGIVSFTTAPLQIATYTGILCALLAFLYFAFVFVKTLIFGIDVPGYASQLVVILFIGGIQLLVIGILGEYLSRMFLEIKRRPIYIAKSEVGFADKRGDLQWDKSGQEFLIH